MPAHFGLDIGFSSIKVLQVSKEQDKFRVEASGVVATPVPLESTADKDKETLALTVGKLIKDAGIKIKEVVVALPESQVTSKIVELPYLSQAELASAIEFEAEQYIPLPLSEVELSWEILTPDTKTRREKILVLLVAARKTIIERLLEVLERARLNPQAVETELVAASRVLTLNNPAGNFMAVDLGRRTTDMAIVANGNLSFLYSAATGGDALTRAIVSELKLDFIKAEEYKRSYGLNPNVIEGKVANALRPVIQVLTDTMRKALSGFQQQGGQPIKTVFLCGGAAQMPGLASFLAQQLGLEVNISDPFQNFIKDEKFPAELKELASLFNTVAGLALREV